MNKIVYLITGVFAGLLIAYVGISLGQPVKTGAITNIAYLGSTMSVTSTSVTTRKLVLSANSGRQYTIVQNGANPVYLSFDPASTTNAIYLASTSQFVINTSNLYNGNIYAVSVGATSTVIVTEK